MAHVIAALRPRSSFNLAIGAASVAATLPAPVGITHVRLVATQPCYVQFSSGPEIDAVAGDMFIAAGQVGEVFKVAAGDIVSCIGTSGGTAGSLNVTWMSP